MSDIVKPNVLVTISLLAVSIGNILFSVVPVYSIAFIGRALTGLGGSLIYVPGLRFLASNFPRNRFGQLSAILIAMNFVCVMLVNGPLALVSEIYGWRSVFLVSTVATVFSSLLLLWLGWNDVLTMKIRRGAMNIGINFLDSVKEGLSNKLAWPMFFRSFVSYGVFLSFQSLWAGPYMMIVLGMNRMEAGTSLVLMALASVIAGPIGGYLSDKVLKTRRKMIIAAMSLSTLCWIFLVVFINSLTSSTLRLLLILMGCFYGLASGVQTAQIKEVFPEEKAGIAMGLNGTCLTGGGAVLPMLFGFILGSELADPHLQFRTAFLLNLSLVFLATVASILAVETYQDN